MLKRIINIRIKPPKEPEMDPKKGTIDLPKLDIKLPLHRQNGFKRKLGALLLVVGGIMRFIPQTLAIGEGLVIVGGVVAGVGVGHGLVKNRQKKDETKVDQIAWLRILADLIIKIINIFKKR